MGTCFVFWAGAQPVGIGGFGLRHPKPKQTACGCIEDQVAALVLQQPAGRASIGGKDGIGSRYHSGMNDAPTQLLINGELIDAASGPVGLNTPFVAFPGVPFGI